MNFALELSLGKLKNYEITKDMPFSLIISTMRRKRLIDILMSEEQEWAKDTGIELMNTYWNHLNKLRGNKFEKLDRKDPDDPDGKNSLFGLF